MLSESAEMMAVRIMELGEPAEMMAVRIMELGERAEMLRAIHRCAQRAGGNAAG